ncbi:hypothetical protein GR212_15705 [Rhizobium lusitanum]|uniref:Uncharacterized protein n=1 Tax=Rhizobium lusitanum TaxID=293958 RepID=A0A6L9U6V7_9HYPH|nr:hypothetical protein [Rhizobium lusitanum]NEI71024.1 hypothetical protein [Rhizobium lusitanum]
MDTGKLTPLEFCIIVTWMHGWTIRKIHLSLAKRHGKTEHAVRGIINKLPQRRQSVTRVERQTLLDGLKAARIDDGMLPADYFIAKPLASDQQKKAVIPTERKAKAQPIEAPAPDPKTRAGRREIKRRREEAERKERDAQEERARREAGHAPRGVDLAPLEYLYNEKMLSDPKERKEGEVAVRTNNAMRRYESGVRLRSMMESIYGSGVKSPDYESAGGGGGAGVVIHAVVAENIKNVAAIRSMVAAKLFVQLEQMLMYGMFVWQIPGADDPTAVMADIRCALDKVSQFLGMMPAERQAHDIPKRAEAKAVRASALSAREAIATAQREVK